MQPTYGDGGYSLMFPLIYMWRGPERGDVVAIRMPGGGAFYVKRILGLPGEEIQFDKGSLLINQQTIPEPYIQHKGEWDLQPIRIPAGYYFVAGDNRLTSFDGHTLGTVNRKRIAGIVYP